MKIENTNILMASVKTLAERDEQREVLRAWVDPQGQKIQEDRVSLTYKSKCSGKHPEMKMEDIAIDDCTRHEVMLRKLLVEVMIGRKIKLLDPSQFQKNQESVEAGGDVAQKTGSPEDERVGWGISYSREGTHYEKEQVSFVAAGIIRTEDSKEIEFSLQLNMSRETITYNNLNFRAGDAVLMDPLVVNFDGKAAELRNLTFSFDLDSDGVEEDLPMIGSGNGFLALDLNNDGMVTNGSELFGPRTGNGFSELSLYDEDGNDWIDENDPVYDQLSVWTMDGQGNSSLNGLRDRGIGAIYLGNLSSKFDLTGGNDGLMGQISRTGVYLNENGVPGTIQQLDLVV